VQIHATWSYIFRFLQRRNSELNVVDIQINDVRRITYYAYLIVQSHQYIRISHDIAIERICTTACVSIVAIIALKAVDNPDTFYEHQQYMK
jgi:hypothetical protein